MFDCFKEWQAEVKCNSAGCHQSFWAEAISTAKQESNFCNGWNDTPPNIVWQESTWAVLHMPMHVNEESWIKKPEDESCWVIEVQKGPYSCPEAAKWTEAIGQGNEVETQHSLGADYTTSRGENSRKKGCTNRE